MLYAVGHAASAFAPDYTTLLVIRLLMISGAAIFTPQAASAVALMVPEDRRASSVAIVFMGWAVSGAVVIPIMSILAETLDWRIIYGVLAVGSRARCRRRDARAARPPLSRPHVAQLVGRSRDTSPPS